MSKEKRRQTRLDANLFAELYTDFGASLGRGVVVDVSLSGFGVETEADLSKDMIVNCHIEVPLNLKAVVVRSIQAGQIKRYGLRFVGQGLLDKFILKKILKGNRQTRKVSL